MKTPKLLSRDDFRESVFARDGHACVFCKKIASDTPEGKLDAHHIMERRLWTEPHEKSGYFLENGATVCEACHRLCEQTIYSTQDCRDRCSIPRILLPDHLYTDQVYDKWGNIILPNGQRIRGEIFYDESVQKILGEGGVLPLFTNRVKYPRTLHLPWSAGMHDDDRMMAYPLPFDGKRVIVTRKMDGENSSIYSDYFHARSIDGRHHPSRNWAKQFASTFQHDIPQDWRICAENLYAQHSIVYDDLESYLLGFSVWDDKNICLSWDDSLEWFALLGLKSVPVLYDGLWDEAKIKALYDEAKDWSTHEGYVVRLADAFPYGEFRKSVAKYVRHNHVATSKHNWQTQAVIPNGLLSV